MLCLSRSPFKSDSAPLTSVFELDALANLSEHISAPPARPAKAPAEDFVPARQGILLRSHTAVSAAHKWRYDRAQLSTTCCQRAQVSRASRRQQVGRPLTTNFGAMDDEVPRRVVDASHGFVMRFPLLDPKRRWPYHTTTTRPDHCRAPWLLFCFLRI